MKKIERSDLIAILAVFISFISLWLGVYEARIMKEEQELMLTQQKAAVWPYLETTGSYKYEKNIASYKSTLKNKGVGPALIKEVKLKYKGEYIENNYLNFLNHINPILNAQDKLKGENNEDIFFNYGLQGLHILSPEEEVELIFIKAARFKEDRKLFNELFTNLSIEICYESIYEDSWLITGPKQKPIALNNCTDKKPLEK